MDTFRDVLTYLRLTPGSRAADRAQREYEAAEEELNDLGGPRSTWVLVPNNFESFPAGLRRCPFVALGLATAGEAVSLRLTELYTAHQYFRAAVLDALCNVMLSAETDRMHHAVLGVASSRGLHLTRRFSPGCPHMDLSCQADIVRALPEAASLGVSVHPSGMLLPLKSLTFVLGASNHLTSHQPRDFCDTCRVLGCPRNRRAQSQ